MLDREKIKTLFHALNKELCAIGVIGEIGICGGAVMCLVFNASEATKDVDGIFQPTCEIREAALRVAQTEHAPKDWLNDAAKEFFLTQPPSVDVVNLSNLRVWAPTAEYMLAMKCISARFDTHDGDDVEFLVKHLALTKPDEVYAIIEEYYPRQHIPPKTQFLIEELFGG